MEVDVYDPAYFAAITFAAQAGRAGRRRGGCDSVVHRPETLDPATARELAVIPADQRTLPPELFAVTDKLVNGIRIDCK